jgi:hypothetical protein
MEKGATNWWKNPDKGRKVSQTRLLLQFSLLMLAAATGHNIIQVVIFN